VIDLESRRRLRANGVVAWRLPASLALGLREVFWNCPKYIQRRGLADGTALEAAPRELRAWIEAADTLFVASAHAERGADASHRGGVPGFVRLLGPDLLEIPDYAGNAMFQTLGNLALDPRVGLCVPDFARGRVLQLTAARVDWDPAAPRPSGCGARARGASSASSSARCRARRAGGWSSLALQPPPPPAATMRAL
jgi:hypothetical protein